VPVVIDYGTLSSANPMPFLYDSVEINRFPCNSTRAPGSADMSEMVMDNIKVTN
jgi:hypothetical protein